ncbi:MAG TPA: mandelate racemase/muconate lactonizing enzyme family protein [Rhodospirillales bacterium]|nr:mandelate racemase/muconate lactonizing enzyme family protein [Rhodospirillales bacterium]
MKIREIRCYVLEAKLDRPFGWSLAVTDRRSALVVEVTTDEGISGFGECYGPPSANAAVVALYGELLRGRDPLATEAIWQELYNALRDHGQRGLAVQALSGIDIALWDIRGKAAGRPIHALLGGPIRRRVRAYATGLYERQDGHHVTYLAEEARGYVAEGFSAMKLKVGFGLDRDLAAARAVRKAIGPGVALMVDANHAYDLLAATELGRRLAELDIAWFEEPIPPEDVEGYAELRRRQPLPVAGGECSFTRFDFRRLFTARALDVAQPDTCAAGGISECKKIADMAAAFGVRYIPHVWGTGIALAASLQLLAVLPNEPLCRFPREPLLEFDRTEHPIREAILERPIGHRDGWVEIPDGPGLGVAIDGEALRRFAVA